MLCGDIRWRCLRLIAFTNNFPMKITGCRSVVMHLVKAIHFYFYGKSSSFWFALPDRSSSFSFKNLPILALTFESHCFCNENPRLVELDFVLFLIRFYDFSFSFSCDLHFIKLIELNKIMDTKKNKHNNCQSGNRIQVKSSGWILLHFYFWTKWMRSQLTEGLHHKQKVSSKWKEAHSKRNITSDWLCVSRLATSR